MKQEVIPGPMLSEAAHQKLLELEGVPATEYRVQHGRNVSIVQLNERERELFDASSKAFTTLWGLRLVRGMKPALQERWNQIVEDFHTPETEETSAE